MKRKVSDLIVEFLKDRGLGHVFGIVGAGNSYLFDSLGKTSTPQVICVHHEQAATMAMQTYFRVSGNMSAAIVTTGGGAVNAITGVLSAWADSIPGLVIAGNEKSVHSTPDNPLRMWGVQGFDSCAMVEKVTKYSARVSDPMQILFELEKAVSIALSGRPGPVWLEVPMDIQSVEVEIDQLSHYTPSIELPASRCAGASLQAKVREIIFELKSSERPLLWLGHGIRLSGGVELLEPLLSQLKIPTLVSWAGIDMIDSDHPLVFGRAGVYGQRGPNFILQNSDFLLTIGTRLALPQIGYDLRELAPSAQIAVVDIDPNEAHKLGDRAKYSVVADAKEFIELLLDELRLAPISASEQWLAMCKDWEKKYPWVGPEHADKNGYINSYRFMSRLNEQFKPDQIIVTDMGTALLSGHQILRLKRGQRLMTSTGLGEMGYGLPAAIGASFASNRGEVLCLNCDGGMMMNLQELQTIVHHKLPIKILIFNNDGYLMIKHTQKALFNGAYSGTNKETGVSCPNFSRLAASLGMPSFQIRTWKDFEAAMPEIQSTNGPLICEIFMDPEQPLVPKLSVGISSDGSFVSPPLEDLSPFLPRQELKSNLLRGLHSKSELIKVSNGSDVDDARTAHTDAAEIT